MRTRLILATLLIILALILPVYALAAELIMLEQRGCVYCKRWDKEIGGIYPKTDEGKLAPLRKVDIHDPLPDDLKGLQIDRFTPTFIVMDGRTEVGRIRGYPGDEFFWFLLGSLLEELPNQAE